MSLHGYELFQKLETIGFHTIDQGSLYRLLRQLEKENLVASEWDTTGNGPAKRCHKITEVGVTYLKEYANQLETYQSILDQFFITYSNLLEFFIPSFKRKAPMTRGGMKMSTTTKKSEQVKKAVVKEEGYQVMPFVDTIWNQFAKSLDWAKELQESGEEAYLKTVKETIKFNKDFRNSFLNLYQESKRTNSEIVDSVSALYKKNDALQIDFPELTDQFRDVSDRVENLALTPIKLSFDLMDRLDNNLVENSENYVHYVRERRNDLLKVTSDYVEIAKNNHKNIFSMIEKSVKVHVNN